MQVFFIRKYNYFKFFNKVKVEKDFIKICKNYQKKYVLKKIINLLNQYGCNNVILDKSLKNDEEFCRFLYSNQKNIINGKILFKILITKLLKYIIEQSNKDEKEIKIAIMQNGSSNEVIRDIVENFSFLKSISIITNNPEYFQLFKEKIYEEKGLVITLTNNKRRSMLRSDIILNIDFPEELVNKYVLNDYAIIVNFEEKINIFKKRFNGRIINNYSIELKKDSIISDFFEDDKYKAFDLKDLAEYYILNNPKELENIIISL